MDWEMSRFERIICRTCLLMLENMDVREEVLNLLEKPSHESCKEYVRKLLRQQSNEISSEEAPLLNSTMFNLAEIIKDLNIHPRIKLQSNLFVMYLVSMMDPDVYDSFLKHVYGIFKGNCLYNKNLPPATKGEDFFQKTKFFTETGQKNQLRRIGASYVLFSLETIYVLAKYYPYEAEDDQTPTKFLTYYEQLRKQGVEFPQQIAFKFYTEENIEIIEENLQEIEKQFYSSIGGSSINKDRISLQLTSHPHHNETQFKKKLSTHRRGSSNKRSTIENKTDEDKGLTNPRSLLSIQNQPENDGRSRLSKLSKQSILNGSQNQDSKVEILELEKIKLQKEIQTQRKFFEDEISRQKLAHQESVYRYQKKINNLETQLEKAKSQTNSSGLKMRQTRQSPFIKTSGTQEWAKEKIIEELQAKNVALQSKVKQLEESIKFNTSSKMGGSKSNNDDSQQSSLEIQVGKLKKENRALKVKLLSECEETSEFSNKKGKASLASPRDLPESLGFIGYENARSCFEPFYSNSSSQIKIRLRKAIIRDKELLYRDKNIQIGSITKLQSVNIIKLIIVFTNISQKPLFNFVAEFITRDDLSIKVITNPKNYLEISGQTKSQIQVTVQQIDFRCLLTSIRYNAEGNAEKMALIMPISKLKLAQQEVFTPIAQKKVKYMKKTEKVFKPDRKVIPELAKFKQYFPHALLQIDKTQHEVYHLKMQFMGNKFYIQCDEVGSQMRLAVKYFEDKLAEAEKLMDELAFLFMKG